METKDTAEGVFQVTVSGRLLTTNLTFARMLGYPSPDVLIAVSRAVGERLWPDPERRSEFRRLLDERSTVRDFEMPVEHRVGGIRWLSLNAEGVRDSEGKILLYKGTAQDITERKRAEEALDTSVDRFRALIENSAEEVAILDADLKPVYVSPSVFRESGYGLEEGITLDILATVHPDERPMAEKNLRKCLKQPGVSMPFQTRLVRSDGSCRWVEGVITNLLEQPRVEGLVVNYHDITASKHAEQEHERFAAELLQAQKMEAVGKLAGGVAHNFNNYLTAIGGYAELVLADLPEDSDIRADVEEIIKATERAAVVASGLLAFSRRRVSCRESLDLNEIVSGVDTLLGQLIGEHIEIETTLAPGPMPIEGDRSQLEQAIVNLAVNAHDAMPQGGTLTIETASVNLSEPLFGLDDDSLAPGHYATLSIRDTGIGMDAETRAKIFETFFTTKDADHGTGLGLSTVYAIVEEADGRIFVESAPNEGTTFTIFLPVSGRSV
jgi:two-component system cell cycle sensor histidine kinase/response regulator CckA